FASLAKSIIYQQIHGKAAASICRRFIELFQPPAGDDNFPAFEQVARMTVADLRPAGLSERKATYILDLAERFNSGEINPVTLVDMSDAEISKLLCRVKGIGQWTVDMFLIFYLKRLDVFPVLDFGVRKGMRLHFDLPAESKGKRKAGTTPEDLISLAEQWKPYRSVAAWYMWQVCDIK
ncbi:DNA glycosylase, partial [Dimargaris cristalligena]